MIAKLTGKERVAVVYDGFPHYRKGVIEELAASDRYDFYFFGDAVYRDPSIRPYEFKPGIRYQPTQSRAFGPFHVQRALWRAVRRSRIDHCIFLGNPYFVSYWILTPMLRLLGKKVYFWSHGWIAQQEPAVRGTLKHLFFKLPNALLLYGHRAKEIGIARGFRAERIYVIGNSLDYRTQKKIYDALADVPHAALRGELGLPVGSRIIICTARVTHKCRFDLLLRAAGSLSLEHHPVYVVIVGEGPETQNLAALAAALGVECRFWGACYDETTLAKLHKACDLTVSPGKVGLTAMHSMAYGTPVISHDNLDHQMPEFEAIIPGVTGGFFVENSSDDLARAIREWFEHHPQKPERACVERIEEAYTPAFQRQAIERALAAR